jgi:hypothetical protein
VLVDLNSNEFLPVIPFIQTEEAANNSRKKVTHRSRKMAQEKSGSNNRT